MMCTLVETGFFHTKYYFGIPGIPNWFVKSGLITLRYSSSRLLYREQPTAILLVAHDNVLIQRIHWEEGVFTDGPLSVCWFTMKYDFTHLNVWDTLSIADGVIGEIKILKDKMAPQVKCLCGNHTIGGWHEPLVIIVHHSKLDRYGNMIVDW